MNQTFVLPQLCVSVAVLCRHGVVIFLLTWLAPS